MATWQAATLNSTAPTGTSVGDLLIAHATNDSAGGVTPPAGWTQITGNVGAGQPSNYQGVLYWRIATGADTPGTAYAFTQNPNAVIAIHRISGVNTAAPINTSATAQSGGAGTTGTISGGITPSVANTLLMLFVAFANNSDTNNTVAVVNNNPSWSSVAGTGSSGANILAWFGSYAPTTTTGNATAHFTPSNTSWGMGIIAIAPALPITVNPSSAVFTLNGSVVTPTIKMLIASAIFLLVGGTVSTKVKNGWRDLVKSANSIFTNKSKS